MKPTADRVPGSFRPKLMSLTSVVLFITNTAELAKQASEDTSCNLCGFDRCTSVNYWLAN